jgi:hypothetical protein
VLEFVRLLPHEDLVNLVVSTIKTAGMDSALSSGWTHRRSVGTVFEDAEATGAMEESASDDVTRWLANNEEVLRAHEGEWIALAGDVVVAHAPSFLQVMQQVEAQGIEDPFLVPVVPARPFVG